jgi:hypothetical protein
MERRWSQLAPRTQAGEIAAVAVDAVRCRRELVLENAVLRHQVNVLRRRRKRPTLPPPGAAQVAGLLDHMIHEQVLACVDLDALHDLERSLTMLVGDLDGASPGHPADLARDMPDRALARLLDDLRRYLRASSSRTKAAEPCGEEARLAGRSSGRGAAAALTRVPSCRSGTRPRHRPGAHR